MIEHARFIRDLDQKAIEESISRAERSCSGEVRVHIQPHARGDIQEIAARTFERLGMTRTELRNGVLLFIASEDHRFVILGDKGIDEKVGHDFWEDVAADLGQHFRRHEFTAGICRAVERCGEKLAEHFPWQQGDRNELSNTISIDHPRE